MRLCRTNTRVSLAERSWTKTKGDRHHHHDRMKFGILMKLSPPFFVNTENVLRLDLPWTQWMTLYRLWIRMGCFCAAIKTWGFKDAASCECNASEQTVRHIVNGFVPILVKLWSVPPGPEISGWSCDFMESQLISWPDFIWCSDKADDKVSDVIGFWCFDKSVFICLPDSPMLDPQSSRYISCKLYHIFGRQGSWRQ